MNYRHQNKAFTLLELMIVVAIIGVLASVAVPGFMRYIRDSKKSEGTGILKSVSDGAMVYYKGDHVYDSVGFKIKTDFYPGCEEPNASEPSNCTDVAVYDGERVIGQRISPLDPNLKLGEIPWVRLNVMINKPFYYVVFYTSTVEQGNSTFSATAKASLNAADDSILQINGKSASAGSQEVSVVMQIYDGEDE